MLGKKLSRHYRDPCPAEYHSDREGQNDEGRDDASSIGPDSNSEEGCEEDHAGCRGVHCPSSKALGSKPAGKHETRYDEPEEPNPSADEGHKAVPAHGMRVCRRSWSEAEGWVGG